ncbi:MAG TPA: 4-alpha-glucanotransferase, partial [Actinomycetota bacterium]|nr:4-alpha-glucanotransferase [Actinomycetota bacterium]
HRYVQFLADGQIGGVAAEAQAALLFDLPLGGHPAGFDVWHYRGLFLTDLCTGAPPDPMNLTGQNWGNPPVHPDRARESGYAYFLACIRHLLAHGGVLRIDHVPGLHRMYVLPRSGTSPGDGAYLRSHADELYALLCLESHRARGGRGAVIVGEDLGTVPAYIRAEMGRHGVYRCYVAEFGIDTGTGKTPDGQRMPGSQAGGARLEPPPANSFASLNTHDVAPFAAFWRGTDIEELLSLGLLTQAQAEVRLTERAGQRQALVAALRSEGVLSGDTDPAEGDVLEAWLTWLARTDAQAVVVTLEDLWGETGAQNLPGTTDEHPNWRRRTAMSLEAIRSSQTVLGRLNGVNVARREADRSPRPHPGRAGRAEGVAP